MLRVDELLPYWDERFVGYGFDRMSRVWALHAAAFEFIVAPGTFIVHTEQGPPASRQLGTTATNLNLLNVFECFKAEWELNSTAAAAL